MKTKYTIQRREHVVEVQIFRGDGVSSFVFTIPNDHSLPVKIGYYGDRNDLLYLFDKGIRCLAEALEECDRERQKNEANFLAGQKNI